MPLLYFYANFPIFQRRSPPFIEQLLLQTMSHPSEGFFTHTWSYTFSCTETYPNGSTQRKINTISNCVFYTRCASRKCGDEWLTRWHAAVAKPAAKELCRDMIRKYETENAQKRQSEAQRLQVINGQRVALGRRPQQPQVPKRVWDSVENTFSQPSYSHSLVFTARPPASKGSGNCRMLGNGIA
jgi:hypothetical protein